MKYEWNHAETISKTDSVIQPESSHKYLYKPFSELNLIDDFMFDVATMDIETCRTIIELSLNIRIREIRWKEGQKMVHNLPGKRGVRLDFYVEDAEGKVFNVEMQRRSEGNLCKRSRFYSAMLDTPVLKQGERAFDGLPPTYIIFICGFDPLGYAKYRYTFERRCREIPELVLGDELQIVFLNTKGQNADEVEPELVAFLQFVEDSSVEAARRAEDARIRKMYDKIRMLKSRADVEASYMKLEERDRLIREDGIQEGVRQGLEWGLEQGERKKLVSLVQKKWQKGKRPQVIADELEEEVAVIEQIIAELEY